jgi:hypothetical protein
MLMSIRKILTHDKTGLLYRLPIDVSKYTIQNYL